MNKTEQKAFDRLIKEAAHKSVLHLSDVSFELTQSVFLYQSLVWGRLHRVFLQSPQLVFVIDPPLILSHVPRGVPVSR